MGKEGRREKEEMEERRDEGEMRWSAFQLQLIILTVSFDSMRN